MVNTAGGHKPVRRINVSLSLSKAERVAVRAKIYRTSNPKRPLVQKGKRHHKVQHC